jgi:RNA polymerase sigma-70 factor, ECF subfamily
MGRRASTVERSTISKSAIIAAQRGDSEGIHFLYARYSSEVLRCIRSIVQDPHDAEDITQDVFAKLITTIGRYEVRDVPFSAWILRVARNAALDHLRSRAKKSIPSEDVVVEDSGREETSRHKGDDLRAALDLLPGAQREVVVLRHVVGLTPTEIAASLGKSENSINGLHHRGRRALQSQLRALGAAPLVARRPVPAP